MKAIFCDGISAL